MQNHLNKSTGVRWSVGYDKFRQPFLSTYFLLSQKLQLIHPSPQVQEVAEVPSIKNPGILWKVIIDRLANRPFEIIFFLVLKGPSAFLGQKKILHANLRPNNLSGGKKLGHA